ncbi:DUF982 domain-containing protein [Agrobacterium rosae]|uniref:DUF982 domain-containing protein n=1 Tax=Agrobacterium rosae TaxID=1972867 RepID=A0AAW9FTA9_9HYPH|nr:DUF982 domain-containing protein [Agrobacterium rosae]MDX8306003.1 DUF982 domain-containing protein [Agrobacterium rosae]
MAFDKFDHPVYAQQKYFVQEICGIDDVFDYLDEWPEEKRNLTYETLVKFGREAACGRFPTSAIRENFRRFLKQNGNLAEIEDIPAFSRQDNDRFIGG